MGLFDFLKKKGISSRSASFARLVKYYCAESGIPVQTQLNITKAISRDFIDNKSKEISHLMFMTPENAKDYFVKNGMNSLDADIFWSILQTNRDAFLGV